MRRARLTFFCRYADMRAQPENHRIIYCEFELDDDECALAERFGVDPNASDRITVRRNYAGQYDIDFTADTSISTT
ncbi:hypothetical protein [Hasllibacter halocynthiae]|uniref:hypothetical protein n=1 Tax=Hasllibacter halocynthiae TaxID=595589 RepID=UPI001304F028|nr:hypothetical protein [Hasllibacter halocynthiae]